FRQWRSCLQLCWEQALRNRTVPGWRSATDRRHESRENDQAMLNRLSPNLATELLDAEAGFDVRDVLNFAWRQWRFILAIVAVALLIGTVQFLRQTPLYTATAQVLLDPRKEKAAGNDAVLSDLNLD